MTTLRSLLSWMIHDPIRNPTPPPPPARPARWRALPRRGVKFVRPAFMGAVWGRGKRKRQEPSEKLVTSEASTSPVG